MPRLAPIEDVPETPTVYCFGHFLVISRVLAISSTCEKLRCSILKIGESKIVSRRTIKIYREREVILAEDFQILSERELAEIDALDDEAAFAEIVRRYSPRVFRVASRFFSRYDLVEEAAAEIFLKAFAQIGRYEARGSLEGWLTRIAVTTCINLTRSAKRQPELLTADLTEDENAWLEAKTYHAAGGNHRQEEQKYIAADLLNRVLNALPPEDALVLQMIDGDSETVRDVAALLDWSKSRVKIKAFRARKRFREIVRELLPKTV